MTVCRNSSYVQWYIDIDYGKNKAVPQFVKIEPEISDIIEFGSVNGKKSFVCRAFTILYSNPIIKYDNYSKKIWVLKRDLRAPKKRPRDQSPNNNYHHNYNFVGVDANNSQNSNFVVADNGGLHNCDLENELSLAHRNYLHQENRIQQTHEQTLLDIHQRKIQLQRELQANQVLLKQRQQEANQLLRYDRLAMAKERDKILFANQMIKEQKRKETILNGNLMSLNERLKSFQFQQMMLKDDVNKNHLQQKLLNEQRKLIENQFNIDFEVDNYEKVCTKFNKSEEKFDSDAEEDTEEADSDFNVFRKRNMYDITNDHNTSFKKKKKKNNKNCNPIVADNVIESKFNAKPTSAFSNDQQQSFHFNAGDAQQNRSQSVLKIFGVHVTPIRRTLCKKYAVRFCVKSQSTDAEIKRKVIIHCAKSSKYREKLKKNYVEFILSDDVNHQLLTITIESCHPDIRKRCKDRLQIPMKEFIAVDKDKHGNNHNFCSHRSAATNPLETRRAISASKYYRIPVFKNSEMIHFTTTFER